MQETQVYSLDRESPEGRNGNLLQYSCLENSMDGGALAGYTVYGVERVRHDWATEHTHSQLVHSYASLKVMWKYLLVQKMLHEMFS